MKITSLTVPVQFTSDRNATVRVLVDEQSRIVARFTAFSMPRKGTRHSVQVELYLGEILAFDAAIKTAPQWAPDWGKAQAVEFPNLKRSKKKSSKGA